MEYFIVESTKTRLESIPIAAQSHDPSELSVRIAPLNAREQRELELHPRTIGFAPPMPVALIKGQRTKMEKSKSKKNQSNPLGCTWGIKAVNAHATDVKGQGVVVAVLDTGICDHEAFKGVKICRRNFSEDKSEDDNDGHGTHCAGTIFGREVNGCRIGVAPGVESALVGKVLGTRGGSTDGLVKAITWAWTNGAHVISMSLGIDLIGHQEALVRKLGVPRKVAVSLALAHYRSNVALFDSVSELIVGHGGLTNSAVLVAAAGNESKRNRSPNYRLTLSPPAAGARFLSVAAIAQGSSEADEQYIVASFSNIGARLAAPGVNVLSAERRRPRRFRWH